MTTHTRSRWMLLLVAGMAVWPQAALARFAAPPDRHGMTRSAHAGAGWADELPARWEADYTEHDLLSRTPIHPAFAPACSARFMTGLASPLASRVVLQTAGQELEIRAQGPRVPQQSAALPRRWSRVYIPDPLIAGIVRWALNQASRQLATPRCRNLIDVLLDAHGSPLADRLDTLGVGIQAYLEVVVFVDGGDSARCRDLVAYTGAGSRVVYLCPRNVELSRHNNPRHLVAAFIHEVLHTLGLGEDPPSSAEITERVLQHCSWIGNDPF